MPSLRLVVKICVIALCIFVLVWQSRSKGPSLKNAQTFSEVIAYVEHETKRRGLSPMPDHITPQNCAILARILMPASKKLLQFAETPAEKGYAYQMKLSAFDFQRSAGVKGAEQKLETFLDELIANEDVRVQSLAWRVRFNQFDREAINANASPENYEKFKSALKQWINRPISIASIADVGKYKIAMKNNVSTEQLFEELVEFIQSPECTLPEEEKEKKSMRLLGSLRLDVGKDPELYGRTLDDKDFDWEGLRKKYVLIKFTATWCGPCQAAIPGLLKAYEKYRNKGLEIVSVYAWERGDDPVVTVKKHVDEKSLPWIILSEFLTEKAGQPKHGDFYCIEGVPTMVLVDKEGKIIWKNAWNDSSPYAKLAEIFE